MNCHSVPICLLSILVTLSGSAIKASTPSNSMADQVSLPYTFCHSIQSETIGESYELWVSVPLKYHENPDRKYPVVYLIDADIQFGIVRDTFILYKWAGRIPEAVVIGIAYGRELKAWEQGRARDLTPTAVDEVKNSGGAEPFLSFIESDIIPMMERHYRVQSEDRTLIGMSYGGLFATYALFHAPELFNRFLISSPSLHYDGNVAFRWEESFADSNKDFAKRVFLSAGTEEPIPFLKIIQSFVKQLEERSYANLKLREVYFEGENHGSVFPLALTKGIEFLFQD